MSVVDSARTRRPAAGPVAGQGQPLKKSGRLSRVRIATRERFARVKALGPEAGLATAEYAIETVAAAGFAGLLLVILKSGAVRTMLTDIIHRALSIG